MLRDNAKESDIVHRLIARYSRSALGLHDSPTSLPAEFLQRKGFSFLPLSLSLKAGDRYLVAITYPCDTLSTKKSTFFCSIGDSPVCLLVFALFVLPVRWLPPAILPSDLGTTTRESPKPPVLEDRPRCTDRGFDEIFQASWLVPPSTSRAACGSSQTFSHPFLQC
jgi:hypothetical protein